MTEPLHPGQRWTSEAEPELGLGSIVRVTERTVTVTFGASAETREYARDNAPLRRVRFQAGDVVRNRAGETLEVQRVAVRGGLVYYGNEDASWCETDLSDTISHGGPEERLRSGRMDEPDAFALRVAALEHQHRRRQSAVRGFVGGRIDLIPHQLYIASEVTGRLLPRVLLADEVGLGKTIEACLIIHRLLSTGRASRVLILVPESLVHQWFVELLRRFNLWFHLFDEERCDAIETSDPGGNPFLDEQLVLAGIDLLANRPARLEQALAAGWDMLVVDEAHHLEWSPAGGGAAYQAVESLGHTVSGLLLLTATPGQLGLTSHFARLRLLDADRFYDFDEFVREADGYAEVARAAERLLADPSSGAGDARRREIEELLDRHGTGRVMFRNTRATIQGFPGRVARLRALPAPPAPTDKLFENLAAEFAADADDGHGTAAASFEPDYSRDPRIDWLAELLRALAPDKVLLICRTRRKVEAIEAALRQRLTLKLAAFHEGLPLVKRDRNAAWFAEDDGARLLLCSEIGSEGRNFQFAHHLVLFDLPLDPELLEQRLGRLDRIGQRSTIEVHVPYLAGSPGEVLARWFHEGLLAFEKNLPGGHELLERFRNQVYDLAQDYHETLPASAASLDQLVAETREARASQVRRLEEGRDRLLELNSFRPEQAARLVDAIRRQDNDRSLDAFMLAVFDHYNIHVEELIPRSYQLGSAGVFADAFPGLPPDGLTVTTERTRALSREDVQFLTWDHPLVTGALDMLLGTGVGNCCFGRWPDARDPGLFFEAVFVLECIAPSALHVDRFLPPTPLRVMLDHRGDEPRPALAAAVSTARLRPGDPFALLDQPAVRDELLPTWIDRAGELAAARVPALVAAARQAMTAQLQFEIVRLRELQKVNRNVRGEEIEALAMQMADLDRHLAGARVRLDAVRLIQADPS